MAVSINRLTSTERKTPLLEAEVLLHGGMSSKVDETLVMDHQDMVSDTMIDYPTERLCRLHTHQNVTMPWPSHATVTSAI